MHPKIPVQPVTHRTLCSQKKSFHIHSPLISRPIAAQMHRAHVLTDCKIRYSRISLTYFFLQIHK